MQFDRKPDLEFTTDNHGAIQVGRNPFSKDKLISGINQINTMVIVELIDGKKSHWGYPLSGKRVAWWLVYKNPSSPPECPSVRSATFFFDIKN